MAAADPTPPEHVSTGHFAVEQVFGPGWRFWVWLKRQFTLTSVLTLAGSVAVLGGWALSLQTRVVVLETRVLPFVSDQGHLEVIDQRLTEHDRRLGTLEAHDAQATKEAEGPPTRRGRR